MFGNVVEHTAQVAHQMFKVKPFRDSDSFLSALDTVIDSLTPGEKVMKNIFEILVVRNKSSGPNSQWPS